MANARVCDKCGKTTTKSFYRISVEKCLLYKYTGKDCVDYSNKNSWDLCTECLDKFKNFIGLDKKE